MRENTNSEVIFFIINFPEVEARAERGQSPPATGQNPPSRQLDCRANFLRHTSWLPTVLSPAGSTTTNRAQASSFFASTTRNVTFLRRVVISDKSFFLKHKE